MHPRPAIQTIRWFITLTLLAFSGEAVGVAANRLVGTPAAWGVFLIVALVLGGVTTATLRLLPSRPAEDPRMALELALADRIEQQRKLRHDIRGALSPVLLVADRLLNHADPAVKRSGEIMVRTVDRATALLAESSDAEANPPAGP